MLTLNVEGLNIYEKQEVEALEFFLNTPKPVVSVDFSIYNKYKQIFEEYPFKYLNQYNDSKIYKSVTIAKNEEFLQTFIEANNTKTNYKFKLLGELFGYPETAVLYFLNDNTKGERYVINYYGLKFICKITDIKQVESELLSMYGLPLTSNKYTKKYA